MEIKLSYNPTYEFTTADYGDLTDPPIKFEALTNPGPEWSDLRGPWVLELDEKHLSDALRMIGLSIVSVSQNGTKWPIHGLEGARALRDAMETAKQGEGNAFIMRLVLGHFNHRWQKLRDLSGNSEEPLPVSDDGDNPSD